MRSVLNTRQCFLIAATLAAMLIYDCGSHSYPWPRWALMPAVVIAALVCVDLKRWTRMKFDALDCLCAALLAWVWASTLWSPDTGSAVLAATRVSEAVGIFYFARSADLSLTLPAIAAIGVLGVVILAVTDPREGNENDTAEFLLIGLPLVLGAADIKKPRLILAMVPACFAISFLLAFSTSHLQWLILLVALIVWLARSDFFAALIGVIAFIEFALIGNASASALYTQYVAPHLGPRLEIWAGAFALYRAHQLFGVGIGGFEFWFHDYQNWAAIYAPQIVSGIFNSTATRVANAHQEFLQVACELGAVGLSIVCAILIAAWRYSDGKFTPAKVAVAIAWLLSIVDFPMEKPATIILSMLALAAMTRRT